MSIKAWFETRKEEQILRRPQDNKIDDSIGKLWVKCFNCSEQIPKKDLEAHLMVCPHCEYHFRINAGTRIEQIFDENTFEEMFLNILTDDPMDFVDTESYKNRIEEAKAKTGIEEAVVVGTGLINGQKVAAAIMDFDFMGGSMGSVVGEKVTRIIEEAIKRRLPVLAITSSGGARMQESALSLMQMAKTACAVAKLNENNILYITVLTEPTYGGVTASFATIGDIVIVEQGARIGFAGRRVIEQTIRQKLPADFQTAEYLMKYGQADIIVKRKDLKETLSKLIDMHINKG